jgi:hypothetical protein
MKIPKINQQGIAHILAPLAFVVVFAAVGGYILTRSHAAATYEYVGGQVRKDSTTGALQQNSTVTLRLKGGSTTYYTYTNNPSAPGYYEFPNKVKVGSTYIMSAYKVISVAGRNVRYCSGHEEVYMYAVGGTNPLRQKNFVIQDKSIC